jgi:hypothetical protein
MLPVLGKDGVECSIHFGGTISHPFRDIRRHHRALTWSRNNCAGVMILSQLRQTIVVTPD